MVSIIIPTYNRPNHLRRTLDYYQGDKDYFKIIVADSSSDENKIINKEIISSFPNLDILYLSDYSPEINPFFKFADALNYVKSKYCLFCGDDDFVTSDGINQSVNFLENNPDFTVVHGHYITFYLKSQKNKGKQFRWRSGYSSESITSPDPKLRLTEHLSKYSIATFYGVHKTDFLKMIFKETTKFTNDGRFSELLHSMLTLIYGKMKRLDVLYGAREINPNSTATTTKNIYDFIKEGSYNEKYANFKNCLAFHLNKNYQLDMGKSKKIIDDAMVIYLKKNYPIDYKYFLKNTLDYLPKAISKKIKTTYRRTKLKFLKPTDNFLKDLDNPTSKYYKEFDKIRNCVITYIKI